MDSPKKGPCDAAREGGFVTVIIEQTEYKVHKLLLAQHSEYFKRALNGSWRESEEGRIPLEDVDREIFDIFVNWLYSQRLPEWERLEPQGCSCSESTHNDCIKRARDLLWMKIHVFANRFQSTYLKGAAHTQHLDEYFAHNTSPYFSVVKYAFVNLTSDNIMLRFSVDVHCRGHDTDADVGQELMDRDELPREFLIRVMEQYSRLLQKIGSPLERANYESKTILQED
ncbi:hypothetical protein E8E11_001476 [Didymella keratinophila]|nr:hypothetical protein E8E11_001476 [Didymella keratinophila]